MKWSQGVSKQALPQSCSSGKAGTHGAVGTQAQGSRATRKGAALEGGTRFKGQSRRIWRLHLVTRSCRGFLCLLLLKQLLTPPLF